MFYGWWVLTACFIMGFYVAAAVFWGFTIFFEPLVAEFNWSYTEVSFAASLRGLEMGILAPLVGFLADRFSLRMLLTIGVGCVGLGLLILSQTSDLLTFYASMAFLAFGAGGCTTVVHMSLMANWFKRRLGLAMGIMGSGFGASGAVIYFITQAVDTYGWRMTLIGLGLGCWLICLPLCLVVRDRPEDMGMYPDGIAPDETPEGGRVPAPQVQEPEPAPISAIPEEAYSFTDSCFSRSFIALFLAEVIRSLVISAVGLHVMPYLSTVGMDRATASLVASGLPLVSIVGRFGFGYLGDKLDKRLMMALALLMVCGGLLVYYYVKDFNLAVLFLLLFAPGMGGGMVLRASILRSCFRRAHFGRLLGLVMAAAAVGGITGPPLAGWWYDNFGEYQPLWLIFSAIAMLSAVLIRFIRPVSADD